VRGEGGEGRMSSKEGEKGVEELEAKMFMLKNLKIEAKRR
jgi:hypothetical protein